MKVYLSYSHADADTAMCIARDLESCGINVWQDTHELSVGDSIPSELSKALRDADYVVVLLSQRSASSAWVRREWSASLAKEVDTGRTILLPALLDDCVVEDILRDKLFADFRASYFHGLSALVGILSRPLVGQHMSELVGGSITSDSPESTLTRVHAHVVAHPDAAVVHLLNTIIYSTPLPALRAPSWIEGQWKPAAGWGTEWFSKYSKPLMCTNTPHPVYGNTSFGRAICSFGQLLVVGVIKAVWAVGERLAIFRWRQEVGNDMSCPEYDDGWGFWIASADYQHMDGLWWFEQPPKYARPDYVRSRAHRWILDRILTV